MEIIKTYKKGKVIIEVHRWSTDSMRIIMRFPNTYTAQFVCCYDELLVEYPPAKEFILENLKGMKG